MQLVAYGAQDDFLTGTPEINQTMKNSTGAQGVYARWMDFIGEQLVAQVEVEIGGQRIDRQYGDWMHIWNQLTMSAEQQRGYFKMIGHTTQLVYITDPAFAAISGPCAAAGGPAQVCAPRNALPETTLYIPLQFWWNKNPGLSLPLIALTSAGQKSTHLKTSEPCFEENMFESRDEYFTHSQVLVSCY